MSWSLAVESFPGRRHVRNAEPCQDHGLVRTVEGRLGAGVAGAIADGAGSARFGETGARIAAAAALDALAGWLGSRRTQPSPRGSAGALLAAYDSARAAVLTEAARMNAVQEAFATTLLAFVATPDWLAALQLGDGFIVARGPTGYELLFAPDKGEYVNETRFVTDPGSRVAVRCCFKPGPWHFIAAATDGLENVALKQPDWLPHAPFFEPFDRFVADAPPSDRLGGEIKAFLGSDRLDARTDDDRTLLLCGFRS